MKKSILNLGKNLSKLEQKQINGGAIVLCPMEVGGCTCNCYWDEEGRCVTNTSIPTKPCN